MHKPSTLDISNNTALSKLYDRTYESGKEVFDLIWADQNGNLIWHQEVSTTSSDYDYVSYNSNQLEQAKSSLQSKNSNTSQIIESHTHPDMSSSLSQQDISTITENQYKHSHLLRIEANIQGRKGVIYRLFEPDGNNIKANEVAHWNNKADSKNTFLFVDKDDNSKIIRKEEIVNCLDTKTEKQIS